MLNPWFALSVQAFRFGLEAQNNVFAGFLRLAKVPKDSAPETGFSEVPSLPETVTHKPAEIVAKKAAIVQAVKKVHKQTRRKGRMRR
jgi:hypothetical protein